MAKRTSQGLTLRAAIVPSTLDEERRTVGLTWSAGAAVLRSNRWGEKFFEKLSLEPGHVKMDRLQSGRAPLLAGHDDSLDGVIGVVEAAALERGVGTCTVRFAKGEDDAFAEKIFRKVKDGIIANVSVGYRPGAVQQLVEAANDAAGIPTLLVTDWEPYEVSMVSMGEDPAGAVRSLADTEPSAFWPQLTRSISQDMEPHMTPEQVKAQAEELAKREAALKAREAELAEEKRKADILELVKRAAVREGFNAGLGDELVKKGVSVDQARSAILDEFIRIDEATAGSNKHRGITAGETEDEKFRRGLETALLLRADGGALLRRAKAKQLAGFERLELGSNEFRGFTLPEVARAILERRGLRTAGMSRMEIATRALNVRSVGLQGTVDFPTLLENVMGKLLYAAYATQPDTWRRFCKVELVNDFRPSPRYRTGALSVLDEKNEHGEFQNKPIPDGERIAISTRSKGNIIAITRELIVNDDMGALSNMASMAGRAAARSIEEDVYNLLKLNAGLGPTMGDGQPFFHANRANVSTTAGLTVAGIDADRVVLASQKDPAKQEFLDLRPAVLVVPLAIGGTARVVNSMEFDGVSNKFQVPNSVRGLFRDVVDSPRLSGTRRYLFADPMEAAAIVVAFLEEQGEAPVLETQDGWRVDGTELKVRFDFRAQVFDPRGAVTNAG